MSKYSRLVACSTNLNGVEPSVLFGHNNQVSNALKWCRGPTRFQDESPLGNKQGTFTQDIGIHLSVFSHGNDFTFDVS